MRLNARFVGAGDETGLVLEGSDLFVSRPLGLAVLTSAANADCASADQNCSVFRRAGEDFDLTVRGVAWTDDGDTNLNDNPVTPNYRQNAIVLGHQLVAPLPGDAGTLGRDAADIANLGETTVAQHVSEVGVFRFSATPPANAYFGYTVGAGASADTGRFIPHDFSLSVDQPGLLPSACSAFSYSGQTMEGWSAAPRISIRPRNADGVTTTNYRDGFMRLTPAGLSFALPGADASATGVDGNPLPVAAAKQAGALDEPGGGILHYTFSLNDSLSYQRSANARVAPFVADLGWRLTAMADQDGVAADGLPLLVQPAGVEIRYGRLALEPAHGSERTDQLMTTHAEYWNGFAYATNTADLCTPALPAALACVGQIGPVSCPAVLVEDGGILVDGKTVFRLRAPNATGTLRYTLGAPAWLRFDWNNDGNDDEPSAPATFGIYEGNPNMIHMREIWR
jgi:MSHA biogenesis protein MshQ